MIKLDTMTRMTPAPRRARSPAPSLHGRAGRSPRIRPRGSTTADPDAAADAAGAPSFAVLRTLITVDTSTATCGRVRLADLPGRHLHEHVPLLLRRQLPALLAWFQRAIHPPWIAPKASPRWGLSRWTFLSQGQTHGRTASQAERTVRVARRPLARFLARPDAGTSEEPTRPLHASRASVLSGPERLVGPVARRSRSFASPKRERVTPGGVVYEDHHINPSSHS